MMKKIILSFVATLTLLPAQTLQQSIENVLETNPVILERLANYRETSKDLSIANSEYLPTLDLVSSIGHEKTNAEDYKIFSEGDAGKSLNYYENSLTLMLNVFDGFGTTQKVDYQKARIVAAAYHFVEKTNDIAFETTRTYIEVIKQRELLTISKENISINEDIFNKVKELYSVGATTKSEMRKIESSLFLARANLVVQENNTIDAIFNFKKTYGERIDLDELEIPSFKVMLPKSLNEATAYSIRNNPSLMVTKYNIKAAQALKKQKDKNFYPRIDLMVQQSLDNNTYGVEDERNRFRAGVNLTYNFYRGGADSATSQKSISAIHRDVQTKNELQRQVIEGLELSWSAYSMIEKQIVELERYRDFSGETLELYQDEYDLGRRTLLDLLSAQNDLINAKSQIVRANYDSLFAKYRILDSMGLLINGVMGNNYEYMNRVGLTDSKAVDNEDTLPISFDEDNDNISVTNDMCQSSLANTDILSNGCKNMDDRFSSVKHFELLHFDRKTAHTTSNKTLDTIVSTIKDNDAKILKVLIHAHTSYSSDKKGDYKLSKKYAKNVKQAFLDAGLDASKIHTISDGNSAPISTDENLNDRANVIMYLK